MELLVVVAIIGILATIVFVSYNRTQAKSRDSRRIIDFETLKTAVLLYKDDTKLIPTNPCGGGSFCIFPYPGGENGGNINSDILSELINGKYIDQLPSNPKGTYYYFGSANTTGAHYFITSLESWSGADAYPGTYRGTVSLSNVAANGYYTCEIGHDDSSYCVSVP